MSMMSMAAPGYKFTRHSANNTTLCWLALKWDMWGKFEVEAQTYYFSKLESNIQTCI